MELTVVGIDISKKKFDAALLVGAKVKSKAFANTATGFAAFNRWLSDRDVEKAHVCLEATGVYGDALATFLHEAGHVVSVVNPARIKGFGQGELSRTKTDKTDAAVIARFCLAMRPDAWEPPPPERKDLQALVRRVEALSDLLTQETNRLAVAETVVRPSIEEMIGRIKDQIKATRRAIRALVDRNPDLRDQWDLLTSIPGVGAATAAMVLAAFGDVNRFADARRMAAFCGLTPKHRQSGSSVRGKSRMSKTGSARIRRGLYLPAVVALRCNPVMVALGERLRANGKCNMVVIGAAMRKLVHIIYGVLNSGKPFDPTMAIPKA